MLADGIILTSSILLLLGQSRPARPYTAETIDLLAIAQGDPRIERVARAICRVRGINPDHIGPPFPQGPLWEYYIPDAARFLAQLDAATKTRP